MSEIWFQTDPLKELKESVIFSKEQITKYLDKKGHIKWPIIATASTLEASCVVHLRGNSSNNLPILQSKNKKEWLEVYYKKKSGRLPSPRLDFPKDLYKKALNHSKIPYHVRWLVEKRNEFTHFVYGSLSVELSGFETILHSCWLDILEILEKPIENQYEYSKEDIENIILTTLEIINILKS